MKKLIAFTLIIFALCPVAPSFAARGCGVTSGVASTDVMVSGALASTTARSFWMRVNSNTIVSSARLFHHETAGAANLSDFAFLQTSDRYRFIAGWSTTSGLWTTPATTGAHTVAVTYNGTGTGVNPVMYVDGSSVTVTTTTTPIGTLNSDTQSYYVCNVVAGDRVYDGSISEFAIWNVILTGTDITNLNSGVLPDALGTAPIHYWRICGKDSPETNRIGGGTTLTLTGTLQASHPISGCNTNTLGLMGVGG